MKYSVLVCLCIYAFMCRGIVVWQHLNVGHLCQALYYAWQMLLHLRIVVVDEIFFTLFSRENNVILPGARIFGMLKTALCIVILTFRLCFRRG